MNYVKYENLKTRTDTTSLKDTLKVEGKIPIRLLDKR